MTTLKKYCESNISALNNYEQASFTWKEKYNTVDLCKINSFKKIFNNLPESINRDYIIQTIKDQNYYEAFAAIMLWGGVGIRPKSNKSKRTKIAGIVLNHSKNKIETIFRTVIEGNDEKIKLLYHSLEKDGSNKILEVDVSYFTKILSFASEASNGSGLRLLIYDKWTKLIHAHILLDNQNLDILTSFYSSKQIKNLYSKLPNEKRHSTKLINPRNGQGYNSYVNYCNQIQQLAESISSEENSQITAFKLESYLFGRDLKSGRNKASDNPRFWAQQNFANHYLLNI